jgi:small conductance mechanosensitive channel
MESSITFVETWVFPWSIKIFIALGILIVGKMLGSLFTRFVMRVMERANMDAMLVKFLGTLLNTLLFIAVVVAAIDGLGVNVTSLLAIMGAAGLAVGLALKDSLSNLAAGVMIIVFRPFRIGDTVTAAGCTGTVDEIGMFSTLLHTADNQRIVVPNSTVINSVIINATALPMRRIDLIIGISYKDDIGKARDIITKVVEADTRVLKDPAFSIGVNELTPASVDLYVRPWVFTSFYWDARAALMEQIKNALEAEGLTMAHPSQQLFMQAATRD